MKDQGCIVSIQSTRLLVLNQDRETWSSRLNEINHPARFDAEFSNGFLILGVEVGFKGVDVSTVEAFKRGGGGAGKLS